VLWYLMTDSKMLQHAAKKKYGKKLVTHEGTVDFYGSLGAAGTLSVVGEQYLWTFYGAHIVTKRSGLGRQAAVCSRAFCKGIDPILYYTNRFGGCNELRQDGIFKMMSEWSGI